MLYIDNTSQSLCCQQRRTSQLQAVCGLTIDVWIAHLSVVMGHAYPDWSMGPV